MANNPYANLSLDQLYSLRNAAVKQKATGFAGDPTVLSSAPTAQAAASERAAALLTLKPQRTALNNAQAYINDLVRFNELNRAAGTGGILEQTKYTAGAAKFFNPALKEMDKLSTSIAVKQANFKGQGGTSNFERQLFGMIPPNIKDTGGVNTNTLNAALALKNEEADRLAFMEMYVNNNRTLNQADDVWNAYVKENPYQKTEGVSADLARKYGYSPTGGKVVPNTQRVPWKQYFGADIREIMAGKPTATPTTTPTATPKAPPTAVQKSASNSRPAGVGANWVLMKDREGNKAYQSPDGKQFIEVP